MSAGNTPLVLRRWWIPVVLALAVMTGLAVWKYLQSEARPNVTTLDAASLQTELDAVCGRLGVEPRVMRGRTNRTGIREFRGRVPLNFPAEEFTYQLSLRLAKYGATVRAEEQGKQKTIAYEVIAGGKPAATVVLQRRPDMTSSRKE
jgi:hypothetical protein